MPNNDFWLKLLDPGTIAAIVAGICTVVTTIITARANARRIDQNTKITVDGVNKVDEAKSAVREVENKATVAATTARKAEMKAAQLTETLVTNHDKIEEKLDKVVHELNGGFKAKVREAMAEDLEQVGIRLNHVDMKLDQLLSAVKQQSIQPAPQPS